MNPNSKLDMKASKEKAISSAYIATNNIIGAGAEGAAGDAANYWKQSRQAEPRRAETSEEPQSNVDWPEYEKRMASLNREFFWQLKSGRYVEDVLIEAARSTQMQRLGLYTQCPSPLASPQTEAFYLNQCYGMIASLVRDVPNMTTILGEKTLPESASRRNDARGNEYDKANHRRNLGDRVDLIFSVQQIPPYSIGVAEASPTYQDDFETKFMKDKKKITRELHDLLRCRLDDIPLSTCTGEFAVVGFMISANSKSILDDISKGEILSSGVDSDYELYNVSSQATQPSNQAKRDYLPKQQESPGRIKRKQPKSIVPRKAARSNAARDDHTCNFTQVAPVPALRKMRQKDGEVDLVSSPKYSKSTEDMETRYSKPMKINMNKGVAYNDSEGDSDEYRKYEREEEEEVETEGVEVVEVIRRRGGMIDLPLAKSSALPNEGYSRTYNYNSSKKLAPGGSRKP
ncbi:hypothetical protein BGZ49_002648 [Haplosporangium sp. Z 27]|nr:hypothetical protein BGZ49_002648 [Haplosporangium sp. Z 27]